MVQLLDLKTFLEKNALMSSINLNDPSFKNDNSGQQDAYLRERQSLMFLQQLLNHSLQVLGLWKVVTEHGFELLSRNLNVDDQNMIKGMYFRDLIISLTGKQIPNLIQIFNVNAKLRFN